MMIAPTTLPFAARLLSAAVIVWTGAKSYYWMTAGFISPEITNRFAVFPRLVNIGWIELASMIALVLLGVLILMRSRLALHCALAYLATNAAKFLWLFSAFAYGNALSSVLLDFFYAYWTLVLAVSAVLVLYLHKLVKRGVLT